MNGKKSISLNQIITFLFFVLVFTIQFCDAIPLKFLGEMKKELSAQVSLIIIPIFILKVFLEGKMYVISSYVYKCIILLIIIMCISFFYNLDDIFNYYFKYRHGVPRFISQFMVIIFYAIIIIHVFYNILIKMNIYDAFIKIRKILFWGFIIVFSIGVFEFGGYILHIKQFQPLYNFFIQFVYKYSESNRVWDHGRICSIFMEPPQLATYSVFVTPFFLSYIITEKKYYKYLPAILVLILGFISGSRTAFVILILQYLLFLYIFFTLSEYKLFIQRFVKTLFIGSMFGLIIFGKPIYEKINTTVTSFKIDKKNDLNVSNLTRWGTQVASFKIFLDHPLFGVGYGQQGFIIKDYYPKWSFQSYEVRDLYVHTEIESPWPPGYNIYTRLLAETGLIGFLLFILYHFLTLFFLIRKMRRSETNYKLIYACLIVSIIGFLANFGTFDSFRLMSYWLIIALSLVLLKKNDTVET